ncbi:hypothetical protein [Sabulibacter ruber]|uniref:hypothetical protein n=1 Tax=Sabulibacter ruber TaxID=2811901 RepID=UPI003BF955D1
MECQGHPATFFFNLLLKSYLPRFTGIFASVFSPRIAFFPESVRAMAAAAPAAITPPPVVLFRENHQPLLVEIIVAGFQRKRFWFHAAKIQTRFFNEKTPPDFRFGAVFRETSLKQSKPRAAAYALQTFLYFYPCKRFSVHKSIRKELPVSFRSPLILISA